jgi:hypothetical protein
MWNASDILIRAALTSGGALRQRDENLEDSANLPDPGILALKSPKTQRLPLARECFQIAQLTAATDAKHRPGLSNPGGPGG